MKKSLLGAMLALTSLAASAAYNANGNFVITSVAVYTDSESFYFTVAAPPSHPVCSNTYFVVSGSVPADQRKALLARLLVAKTTGEAVNIGYDATGVCAEGYIRVYRIG